MLAIKELGHVVLYVSDLERSAGFYRDILGFHEIVRKPDMAMFSSGRTHHELLLIGIGREPDTHKELKPGLYHIGFKIGDTDDALREAIASLEKQGVTIVGTADHTVTHSLYILDPDGNELELYVDVDSRWQDDPNLILSPPRPLDL